MGQAASRAFPCRELRFPTPPVLKDPVHNSNLGLLSKGRKRQRYGLGKKSIALLEARVAPAKTGFGRGFFSVYSHFQLVTEVSSTFGIVRSWHLVALCVGDKADFAAVATLELSPSKLGQIGQKSNFNKTGSFWKQRYGARWAVAKAGWISALLSNLSTKK